jgi:hypothetical protein
MPGNLLLKVNVFKISKLILIFYSSNRKQSKVGANGQPISLYVEMLMVTDLSMYNKFNVMTASTDQPKVFLVMKIFLAHIVNGVRSFLLIFYYYVTFKLNFLLQPGQRSIPVNFGLGCRSAHHSRPQELPFSNRKMLNI